MSESIKWIRGDALTFRNGPVVADSAHRTCEVPSYSFVEDAAIGVEAGRIVRVSPWCDLEPSLRKNGVEDYSGCLILPGFVDCHVHYSQAAIIGSYGEQLIEWLNDYAFVAEQAFESEEHARSVARVFLQESLRAGTTTSAAFCTVHPQSVDAFFEESARLGMRNIAGKVLMDRNAPAALLDTPQSGYDQSKVLIERWHGRDRQLYAVTPRFAPTSSPEQLEMTGSLWREHPGTLLQSHVSENQNEIDWVRELYPKAAGYLDVYDGYGLLGPGAILGHGIHLQEHEWQRCWETGTAIAHCPTSNLFLGSGLFDFSTARREERPVHVGLATDVGAGTSLSMLQTMNEAYKVAQLRGFSLSALHAFCLATRGSAEALGIEEQVGTLAVGSEADLVVLDPRSTPLMEFRTRSCEDLEELLFVLMTLGDDRAVRATYVAGERQYLSPSR